MAYLREVTHEETEREVRDTAIGFTVPLASAIWRCAEHGLRRIFISGAMMRWEYRDD